MSIKEILELSIAGFSLGDLLSAAIIFIIGLIVIRIGTRFADKALERGGLERGVKHFIHSCVKVVLWIIVGFIIADSLGIPSATLVASLSVAGLALSLSLQNILTNLFSGFTILFTKPFVTGDYIEIGGVSGEVSAIGLFYTTVSTPDKKEIHVPNSEVASTKIVNCTQAELRRLDLSFSMEYGCRPEDVRAALLKAAAAEDKLVPEPAPVVVLNAYGASGVEYILRAWVASGEYWDVYFRLNESVGKFITQAGLSMAYPHVDVRIINQDRD